MKLGAHVLAEGTRFRVWAPQSRRVDVIFSSSELKNLPLTRDDNGYFDGYAPHVRAGARYQYQLDGRDICADPYSRYQPDGPRGPSLTVDPLCYHWSDADWKGPDPARAVVYELHIGTFTAAGTYDSASRELPTLAKLGITCVEIMPVAEFAGRRGWGYDGVNLLHPIITTVTLTRCAVLWMQPTR